MIYRFSGKYRFLSNMWLCQIKVFDRVWTSVEHAYQAMKTTNVDDRMRVQHTAKPTDAQRTGRTVALREDWPIIKDSIMLQAVRAKFMQNQALGTMLEATLGQHLIEGNTWHDNYWGACGCKECKHTIGKNKLGKILMKVRGEL